MEHEITKLEQQVVFKFGQDALDSIRRNINSKYYYELLIIFTNSTKEELKEYTNFNIQFNDD